MRLAALFASTLLCLSAPALAQTDADDGLAGEAPERASSFAYPETARVDQVDDYHGVEVADPFRWLEDDVRESEDVAAWVEAQNAVTNAYLEALPDRERIRGRLAELWNYERFSLPVREGGRYFFRRNDGLQNQDVLHVQDTLAAEPEVLIDPNEWSEDGATALSAYYPSPDGRYLAVSVQDGGTDWRIIRVMDLETREYLPNEVRWVKFSNISWAADGSGFYYSRYPEPEEGAEFQNLNFNHTVYLHTIGEEQSADQQIYSRPDSPEHGFNAYATPDGEYVLITVWHGTDERYELLLLRAGETEPVELVTGFENDYALAGNEGSTFYFRTNRGAARSRVIAMNVDQPGEENWDELIPESDDTMVDVSLVGGRLIAEYLSDARSLVRVFETDGTEVGEVDLPGLGSAGGFEGDADDPETFYAFSSLARPSTIYRYDVETGESEIFREPELAYDPDDYEVSQVFYDSADGTQIPMFIAHRRGVQFDGTTPTLLYGYGGFNISIRPSFRMQWLAWMDMGGVFASANLRGGGEYGAEWHDAGRLLNKQNVFDDFIGAAEYLIEEQWTSSDNLAIYGRSNGGLLIGAVVNQRPDLFAAALPAVGVMDMLRYTQFTAGRFWTDDYGDPEDPEHFANLYTYSPYHNIADGTEYPPTLVTTADTDDRVVPGHSFKYIARLQEAQAGDDPVLIRIETRAGHGSGTPTDKEIALYTDQWSFIAAHTGLVLEDDYGAESVETAEETE